MRCPECNSLQTSPACKVLETRKTYEKTVTKRRRLCQCGHRFVTEEKVIKRARKLSESQIEAVLKYQDALFSNELADLLDVHVDTIRKIKREHSVQYEKVS
tara:strand:- start:915 stop:1217 length:303 start_codon:yes stop_codon:yes gene_type:complete